MTKIVRIEKRYLNLQGFNISEIEKAEKSGFYSDNFINRKLGRVGMPWKKEGNVIKKVKNLFNNNNSSKNEDKMTVEELYNKNNIDSISINGEIRNKFDKKSTLKSLSKDMNLDNELRGKGNVVTVKFKDGTVIKNLALWKRDAVKKERLSKIINPKNHPNFGDLAKKKGLEHISIGGEIVKNNFNKNVSFEDLDTSDLMEAMKSGKRVGIQFSDGTSIPYLNDYFSFKTK
ncbi:hypothetical protein DAC22_80 [Bacteroides phage DAC22]|nr:hypothetical protein DAC22_80 [Bacteroides phage DAC22]